MAPIVANPRRIVRDASLDWLDTAIFSTDETAAAQAAIGAWPGYAPTPLRTLSAIAAETGVGQLYYKDEAGRFGLGSFKALGGAYAVAELVADTVEAASGRRPSHAELAHGDHRAITAELTVASATAGNHGRSVAWGARTFGSSAVIFIHEGVGEARAAAIAALGARVVRTAGDYDDSVREAARAAAEHGWTIVSDTSYPGYTAIPKRVMAGYAVMLAEVVDQLGDAVPTHVVLQGGVGGLAAAAVAALSQHWRDRRPRFVIVEPERADCLYQSARAGAPAHASGGLGSVLLGLDCGEVSLIAWDVLDRLADDFALVSDDAALASLARLNAVPGIVAGECSAAGLALIDDERLRAAAGIDAAARVLLIGTEGATDPARLAALLDSR